MLTAYDMVIDRLRERTGIEPRGHGFQRSGRCPAHDDHRNSLSVGVGEDGRVLLNCHAACEPEDVWAALDLLAQDLFERSDDGNTGTIRPRAADRDWLPCGHAKIAEYDYHDAEGNLVYGVTRCAWKCFAQWQPDASKRYGRRWNLDGVDRVLFKLPLVRRAVAAGWVIWITEGEKDALALLSRPGIIATTYGGAGKWLDRFAEHFMGADLVICADNDDPGKRSANQVYRSVQQVARSVEVVLPQWGKDAFDHLASGGHTGNFVSVQEWVRPIREAA